MFGTARWTVLADDLRTPQHTGDRGYSGHTNMITRVAFVVILCLIKHSSLRNVLIKHFGYMCLLGGGYKYCLCSPLFGEGSFPFWLKILSTGVGTRPPTSWMDLEFLPLKVAELDSDGSTHDLKVSFRCFLFCGPWVLTFVFLTTYINCCFLLVELYFFLLDVYYRCYALEHME